MTWTKNSSNWSNGDVPDEADLDAYEDGIYRAHVMCDLAGLGIGKMAQTSGGPQLLMHVYGKASAFTFGTAPVTSAGYARTPSGAPWGADSISGLPYDRTITAASYMGTTTDSAVGNSLIILPDFNAAITVSRVDVQAHYGFRVTDASYIATFGKAGLQVVKIAADGTETNVGSEVFETTDSTNGEEDYAVIQRYLSSTGLSGSIGDTDRLGIRLKSYGHTNNATRSIEVATLCNYSPRGDVIPSASSAAMQLGPGATVAVWFT